jgi:hypothetical protein
VDCEEDANMSHEGSQLFTYLLSYMKPAENIFVTRVEQLLKSIVPTIMVDSPTCSALSMVVNYTLGGHVSYPTFGKDLACLLSTSGNDSLCKSCAWFKFPLLRLLPKQVTFTIVESVRFMFIHLCRLRGGSERLLCARVDVVGFTQGISLSFQIPF